MFSELNPNHPLSSANTDNTPAQGQRSFLLGTSIATQRSWKNAEDTWRRRTEWHRIVAWNVAGELAARLKSGDHVHVQGLLIDGRPLQTPSRARPENPLS